MRITITVKIAGKNKELYCYPEVVGDKTIIPGRCFDKAGNEYSTDNWRKKFEALL